MSLSKTYIECDAIALAELVRTKEVTPVELTETAIQLIESVNPKINAVIEPLFDQALESAKTSSLEGPFCGVPFLMKDLGSPYAGTRMRKGSKLYDGYVPDYDGELTRRFKAAGIITVGKTNAPELGLMPVTEPTALGVTNNPWDLTRTPGGSSGGSAAAVAARLVPMAHGGDGGGSIRIPAACCGLFGFKPTRGRTPCGPRIGEGWQSFVIEHVLTRSVRDSAAMLDATCGPDPGALHFPPPTEQPYLEAAGAPPGKLRIAYTSKPWLGHDVHAECIKGLEKTVRLCEELGHEVVEASPKFDGDVFSNAFMTYICAEVRAELEEVEALIGRKATPKDVEPETWVLGMLGNMTSSAALVKAQHCIHGIVRQIGRFFEDYDILLTPTVSEPPLVHGALRQTGFQQKIIKILAQINYSPLANALAGIEEVAAQAFDFVAYTPPFNATGQPAMSVPLHWTDEDLPIGMQFVGRFAREDVLFSLAGQLEQAQPWKDRRPPICATAS